MKICDNCGAKQSDDRFYCIDCAERLGESIPDNVAKKIERETEDKFNELHDPLHVSLEYKLVGIFSLIGIIVLIVFMIIYKRNFVKAPESLCSIILFAACAVYALIPKTIWKYDKFRLRIWLDNVDNAQPSDYYRISRKIVIYAFFILALLLMVFAMIHLIILPK
jgi:hypothetical protein